MNLKSIIKLVVSIATPQTIASVKAVLGAIKRIKDDTGQDVTVEELAALWDEAEAEVLSLRSKAEASNAAIAADIAGRQ